MPVADLLGSKVYTRIRGVRSRQGKLIWTSSVYSEAQTLGTSFTPFVKGGVGGVPTAILNPRMLRLAVQFQF